MLRSICTPVAAAIVLALASGAFAAETFTINLTNGQEPGTVTPTTTTGDPRSSFGTATFTVNDTQTAMSMVATITGIDFGGQTTDTNDNLTAAHIHAGPSSPPTPTNGVVWGFLGTPFHNNNPNEGVVTPFGTGAGATVTATWDATEGNAGAGTFATHWTNLKNGSGVMYVNFHTSQFTGGEIRGALPEPGSIVGMLAIGSLALVRPGRRR